MAGISTQRQILKLYKRVLTIHRYLPSHVQLLGNQYARAEFDKHRKSNKEFLDTFTAEWKKYCDELEQQLLSQSDNGLGKELNPDQMQSLNKEQQEQLIRLREEAQKVK